MKVSIVTISYNQGRFLEKAIMSVLDQDYPDMEYIVVDPGSTDGSRDIIDKYRSRLTHVLFEPDAGPADGLNKGFKLANGDVFGFINSDDYCLPSALSKIVRYFQEHPNVDVVSGNAHVVDANNNILRYTYSDRYSLLSCAYGCSHLIQPSSFFRAKAYRKTRGFNINNRSNWDAELFIDLKLNQAKFSRINELLSAYRVYDENITGSGSLDNQIKEFSDRRFFKIMGRKKYLIDVYFSFVFRFYRYLTNPMDLIHRIRFGPVYARFARPKKDKK